MHSILREEGEYLQVVANLYLAESQMSNVTQYNFWELNFALKNKHQKYIEFFCSELVVSRKLYLYNFVASKVFLNEMKFMNHLNMLF